MSHDCGNKDCSVCSYVREIEWKLARAVEKLANLQQYLNPSSQIDRHVEIFLTRRLINREYEAFNSAVALNQVQEPSTD